MYYPSGAEVGNLRRRRGPWDRVQFNRGAKSKQGGRTERQRHKGGRKNGRPARTSPSPAEPSLQQPLKAVALRLIPLAPLTPTIMVFRPRCRGAHSLALECLFPGLVSSVPEAPKTHKQTLSWTWSFQKRCIALLPPRTPTRHYRPVSALLKLAAVTRRNCFVSARPCDPTSFINLQRQRANCFLLKAPQLCLRDNCR